MNSLWQDVRCALRTFSKQPAFTAIAVLTLALGIGANSAVFGVVDAVLLRSLPYRQENRLVMVWEQNFQQGQDHNVVSPANFLNWHDQNTVFDQMAGFYDGRKSLTGTGDPEQIPGQAVTTNLFSLLGISPILGRDFSADEGVPGTTRSCC
jgi:putative ABC transport system permease protein